MIQKLRFTGFAWRLDINVRLWRRARNSYKEINDNEQFAGNGIYQLTHESRQRSHSNDHDDTHRNCFPAACPYRRSASSRFAQEDPVFLLTVEAGLSTFDFSDRDWFIVMPREKPRITHAGLVSVVSDGRLLCRAAVTGMMMTLLKVAGFVADIREVKRGLFRPRSKYTAGLATAPYSGAVLDGIQGEISRCREARRFGGVEH